jgi:hypothetical protein
MAPLSTSSGSTAARLYVVSMNSCSACASINVPETYGVSKMDDWNNDPPFGNPEAARVTLAPQHQLRKDQVRR